MTRAEMPPPHFSYFHNDETYAGDGSARCDALLKCVAPAQVKYFCQFPEDDPQTYH